MLEQSIIDAEELRNAVSKLAEQKTIENHSEEYKKLFEQILEQEEPQFGNQPAGLGADLALGDNQQETDISPDIKDELPFAGDVEQSDDNDEIEINFDDLASQLASPDSEPVDSQPTVLSVQQPNPQMPLMEDEEFFLEDLDLEEEMSFEVENVPRGNTGAPTEQDIKNAHDVQQVHDTQKLTKDIEDLRGKYYLSIKENKKLMDVIEQLKEHIAKSNLLNAKLLHVNKALGDNSLNERQKNLFKQKLSEARTVEEAKVIYEALTSAMGEFRTKKRSPESLQEAVQRGKVRSLETPVETQEQDNRLNETTERWRKIAGIV